MQSLNRKIIFRSKEKPKSFDRAISWTCHIQVYDTLCDFNSAQVGILGISQKGEMRIIRYFPLFIMHMYYTAYPNFIAISPFKKA